MIEIPEWLLDLFGSGIMPLDEGGDEPPPCDCDGGCANTCSGCSGSCSNACAGCLNCSAVCSDVCQTRCLHAQAVTDSHYMNGGFTWYPSISSGSTMINAQEWNKLCNYVSQVYSINKNSLYLNSVNSGDPFYAYMFNEVNNAINGLINNGTGVGTKNSMDLIYAYDLNALMDTLNSSLVQDMWDDWVPATPYLYMPPSP